MKQPNIMMVIIEELRGDFLGYAGHPDAETPFLDRLSEEGATFLNHFTPHSKCVPSRACLYSGRYPHVNGHRTLGIPLQKGEINLAKILKENGYKTLLILQNHTVAGNIKEESFDEHWEAGAFGLKTVPLAEYGKDTTSNPRTEGNKYADNYLWGRVDLDESDLQDYAGTQNVVTFLKERKDNQPFFINLNYGYTHPPYGVVEPYYSQFMKKDLTLLSGIPGEDKPDFVYKLNELHGYDRLDEQDRKELQACYLGMLACIDNRIQEIYTALEETGNLENTILIVTSDHGDFVGEYGLPEKWDTIFHDCLIKVPLIIRYPESIQPFRTEALTENIDLLPTLLDMLGLEHPYGIQGKSLVPLIKRETDTHKEYVFCEGGHEKELLEIDIPPNPHRKVVVGYLKKAKLREIMPDSLRKAKMIRTDKWKLVYRIKDKNELYDLEADPREMTNLYYRDGYDEIKRKLEKMILDHLIEFEENLPFDPRPIS